MRIRTRLAAAAVAAVAPFAVMATSATPASASSGPAAIAFVGTANLPTFPCGNCATAFHSIAAAGASATQGVVTEISAPVNYNETCTGGQALQGTADSSTQVTVNNGTGTGDFIHWQRVGLVAVITANPGSADPALAGAAVFAPESLPNCATPAPLTAVIAGAAVIA